MVETNNESRETYNANSDIKFKTSVIRSNLCDYSDVYIHVKATIIVPKTAANTAAVDNTNKNVIFKHCAPFTNTQISKIRQAFANGSSANIKVSKTQLSEMIQSGEFNILGMMNPAEVV